MFRVCDGITNHMLEEHFENSTCLLIDQPTDTFDTTTTRETTDGRFGDALNVVTKNFAMTLRGIFAQTAMGFAATRHGCLEFGSFTKLNFFFWLRDLFSLGVFLRVVEK